MNIAVVGTGYVGLVSGTCFAESGNEVICVDIDAARIEQLKAGGVPIYEPGLEELVRRNIKEGRLSFTTELKSAVASAMVSFIAVGTPMSHNGAADLRGVFRAAEEIAKAIESPALNSYVSSWTCMRSCPLNTTMSSCVPAACGSDEWIDRAARRSS